MTLSLTFQILPMKEHINFYICTGTDPRKSDWNAPRKSGYPLLIALTLTIVVYVVTVARLKIRKMKDTSLNVGAAQQQNSGQ